MGGVAEKPGEEPDVCRGPGAKVPLSCPAMYLLGSVLNSLGDGLERAMQCGAVFPQHRAGARESYQCEIASLKKSW